MGTNYYWYSNPCPTCGHSEQELHIGKSSGGWCFSLHVHIEEWESLLPHNFDEWVNFWKSHAGVIKNEYGEIKTINEMIDIITNRSWEYSENKFPNKYYLSLEEFYRRNHACAGPNNLLRHVVDGMHCVGHGEGTYDYIVGEFS